GVRIEADAIARKRRTLPADVPRRAAVLQALALCRRRFDALAGAQATIQLGALADSIARHAALGGAVSDRWCERLQPGLVRRREILLDRLHGLDDVRVRVEDPIACSCHLRSSSYNRISTSTSAGRPSSLTTFSARASAGRTASTVSNGPSAWIPNPWAIFVKSGGGSSMRMPTTLFSTGRPRAFATVS